MPCSPNYHCHRYPTKLGAEPSGLDLLGNKTKGYTALRLDVAIVVLIAELVGIAATEIRIPNIADG